MWTCQPPSGRPLGVDRDDDALRAEPVRGLLDDLRVLNGGRVDRDLVGAGLEHLADVIGAADAAADGERDEDLVGDAADHVDGGLAAVGRCLYVEKHEFVGTFPVVDGGELDGIAGVAKVL